MQWAAAVELIVRALLKIAEVWDRARKRDAAKERARRVQELDRRIRNDPVAAARRMFDAGDGGDDGA